MEMVIVLFYVRECFESSSKSGINLNALVAGKSSIANFCQSESHKKAPIQWAGAFLRNLSFYVLRS